MIEKGDAIGAASLHGLFNTLCSLKIIDLDELHLALGTIHDMYFGQ